MNEIPPRDIDPNDSEFIDDPYTQYDRLRRYRPVFWSDRFSAWICTRGREGNLVLSDAKFSARKRISNLVAELPTAIARKIPLTGAFNRSRLGMLDPPEHGRLKTALSQVFTPTVIDKRRPMIQMHVDAIIDRVMRTGHMDAVHEFAQPMAARVLISLLGFESHQWGQILGWASDQTKFYLNDRADTGEDVAISAEESAQRFKQMMRTIIKERHSWSDDTLLHELVPLAEETGELGEDELIANCLNIVTAGYQPVVSMLATGLSVLLTDENVLKETRNSGAVSPAIIEELLRFTSPAQLIARTTVEDVDLWGTRIAKGSTVLVSLAAINRDPEVFNFPNEFQSSRSLNRHAAFGIGRHYCLGSNLARVEAEISFSTLLRRLPGIRLAPTSGKFSPGTGIRAMASLPIEWDA